MKIAMFAAAAVAVAAVSLTPGVANAEPWPSRCQSGIGYQDNWSWARCTGGAGWVQAIAKCQEYKVHKATARGRWVWVGKYSYAKCPAGYGVVSTSYTTKK